MPLREQRYLYTSSPLILQVTDFGACRPVTPQSKEIIRSIAKDLLKNLRDGGWKPQESDNGTLSSDVVSDTDEEDMRFEGTISYLPVRRTDAFRFPLTLGESYIIVAYLYTSLKLSLAAYRHLR